MIPDFDDSGNLPLGVHDASWDEIAQRFGWTSRRRELLDGLKAALKPLREAGCRRVFINGSFVTDKDEPGDTSMWRGIRTVSMWIGYWNLNRYLETSLIDVRLRRRGSVASSFRRVLRPILSGTRFWCFSKSTKRPKLKRGSLSWTCEGKS